MTIGRGCNTSAGDLQGKRIKDVVNRMHVAVPQARDGVSRPPVIPAGVAQAREARDAGYKPPTEKDLQVHSHSPFGSGIPCMDFSMQQCLHHHWDMHDELQ